jgi:hypothetical protein
MADSKKSRSPAEAVASQRLAFVTKHLLTGEPALPDDIAIHLRPDPARDNDDPATWFARVLTRLGTPPFMLVEHQTPSALTGWARLRDANGRENIVAIVLEPSAPNRVRVIAPFPAPPGGRIRPAAAADADALAALELETPIVIGEVSTIYDRRRDYFEAERLMGAKTFILERNGKVVGLSASVVCDVRINGRTHRASYLHKYRLHPSAQGGGLQGYLALAVFLASAGESEFPYGFIAEDNEAASKRGRASGQLWSEPCEQILIDTAAAPKSDVGRAATPADAAAIVELLNQTHNREELHVPQTVEALFERLSREPRSYTWSNLLLTERAVVGVWNPGLGVIHEANGHRTNDVRAFVLDYGCTEDGIADLVALLGQSCGRLARSGATELSIFTSAPSRGGDELRALAKASGTMLVECRMTPAADVAERGVYVDQLYL